MSSVRMANRGADERVPGTRRPWVRNSATCDGQHRFELRDSTLGGDPALHQMQQRFANALAVINGITIALPSTVESDWVSVPRAQPRRIRSNLIRPMSRRRQKGSPATIFGFERSASTTASTLGVSQATV